jgi:DivIVA domain-containing protein
MVSGMTTPDVPTNSLSQLREVRFKYGLRGYDVDEVDAFLEACADESDAMAEKLRQQALQLRQAYERVSQLEARLRSGETLAPAAPVAPVSPSPSSFAPVATPDAGNVLSLLEMAQSFVTEAQRKAEAEARHIEGTATDRARAIISEAQNRAQDEIERLNAVKQRLVEEVDTLTSHVETQRARFLSGLNELQSMVQRHLTPVSPNSEISAPRPAVTVIETEPERTVTETFVPPVTPNAGEATAPTPQVHPTPTLGDVLHLDPRRDD